MPFANSIVRDAAAMPSGARFAADLAWERCQEQAAIAYRAGDPITTTRLWTTGLEIAEKHFGRGDPRLASSLTNQALVMRRRRQDYQAKKLFRDALDVWDDSWRWIHLMTPGRAPGGLLRHSEQLDFNALAQRGREATAALERFDEPRENGLDEWSTSSRSA